MSKQPGFDIPVPDKNELRPHMRDATPDKGVLAYAKPVTMVADLGAPRDAMTDWRGTPSPASPTFTSGVIRGVNASAKPEEQSVRTHPGITASERSKKTTQEDRAKKGERP